MLCRESYLKICSIDRRLQLQEESEFRQKVKKWLAPCDPYPIYKAAIGAFQKGTGEWFLDGVLQSWLDGSCQQVLWLQARRA